MTRSALPVAARSSLLLGIGIGVTVALAGCSIGGAGSVSDSSAPGNGTAEGQTGDVHGGDCANADITISEDGATVVFTGVCKSLTVTADTASVTAAEVGTLSVEGDTNTIVADNLRDLTVSGSRNTVTWMSGVEAPADAAGDNTLVRAGVTAGVAGSENVTGGVDDGTSVTVDRDGVDVSGLDLP